MAHLVSNADYCGVLSQSDPCGTCDSYVNETCHSCGCSQRPFETCGPQPTCEQEVLRATQAMSVAPERGENSLHGVEHDEIGQRRHRPLPSTREGGRRNAVPRQRTSYRLQGRAGGGKSGCRCRPCRSGEPATIFRALGRAALLVEACETQRP